MAPTITEFLMDHSLGYTQHLTAAMLIKHDYWENMIGHFTNSLYQDVLTFVTSSGSAVPLVGHNAFIRWEAMKKSSWTDDTDFQRIKIWSETNVSEDFHLSLKLYSLGYTARYITYTGTQFLEGVSLTCHDEIVKLRKFAYGSSELLFHPFKDWFKLGIFTKEWKTYIRYNGIAWTNKISLVGYLFTYFALAFSGPGSLMAYLLYVYCDYYRQYMVTSWEITFYCILVFTVLAPIANIVLKYRLGQRGLLRGIKEEYMYVIITSVFWSSIGWHLCTSILRHLFSLPIVWGATVKEVENTNFFRELKLVWQRYAWLYVLLFLQLGLIFCIIYVPQFHGIYDASGFVGLFPLVWTIGCHMLGPIVLNPTLMRVQC